MNKIAEKCKEWYAATKAPTYIAAANEIDRLEAEIEKLRNELCT